MWIYHERPWVVFLAVFLILFSMCFAGYAFGCRVKGSVERSSAYFMPDTIPSTILGILALILGFTFSMTISRFENRRQLAINEANAIGTAYLRTSMLRGPQGPQIARLLERYLAERIAYYDAPGEDARRAVEHRAQVLQGAIWKAAMETTIKDRGALESIFIVSMNSAFDLRNERNIALSKTLPHRIYWSILFIAGIGLFTFGFVRGEREERGQWQPAILIFLIAFMFGLVLDIDRPTDGAIRITQVAMTDLQASWSRSK